MKATRMMKIKCCDMCEWLDKKQTDSCANTKDTKKKGASNEDNK